MQMAFKELTAVNSHRHRIHCTAIIACYALIPNDAEPGTAMGSLTIRNIDDALKRRLRLRAAGNGRSMEEEVREILRSTVGPSPAPADLGRSIHARFAALGGVELELPPRTPMRAPPEL